MSDWQAVSVFYIICDIYELVLNQNEKKEIPTYYILTFDFKCFLLIQILLYFLHLCYHRGLFFFIFKDTLPALSLKLLSQSWEHIAPRQLNDMVPLAPNIPHANTHAHYCLLAKWSWFQHNLLTHHYTFLSSCALWPWIWAKAGKTGCIGLSML